MTARAANPGLLYQFWRKKLRPRLWTPVQYAPRALSIPKHYLRQTGPKDAPRIAIVTPSLNQGDYLPATIESVLRQEYPGLAYLVRDGGSVDQTIDILKSYRDRVEWRSERDGGQANAINRGFREVDGEIMGYLNSDDILLPGALACVARAFRDHPDVDIVYGHRIFIDAQSREIGRCILPAHDARTLTWVDFIPQETLFWRRRVWDKIGPFDESFNFALDWDFLLRAQAAGFRFKRLPRFLGCFRFHERQKSTVMMADVGAVEIRRIRERYLGVAPSTGQIKRAILGYLLRQVTLDWAWRLGLVRY
jgi:cellulose synthase/poly-beta-1,6-N-acetylglucosamine synthase-like glycosyltransferase